MTKHNDSIYGCSIHKLNEQFQSLLKNEKSSQLCIEEEKLAIMQVLLTLISNKKIRKLRKTKPISLPKKVFIAVSALINPLVASVGGFSLSTTLLQLIPGIFSPITLIINALTAVFSGLFNAGFETSLFRKQIGISIFKLKPTLQLYRKQLLVINQVRKTLLSPQCIKRHNISDYDTFKKTIDLFTNDLREKNTLLKKSYDHSLARTTIKKSVICFNLICYAGAGFLGSKALFLMLGLAALASNPIGWAIGGALAVFSMASFYYHQKKNIYSLIDIVAGYPKKLLIRQNKFIKKITAFESKIRLIINFKRSKEIKRIYKQAPIIQSIQKRTKSNDTMYSMVLQSIFKPKWRKKYYSHSNNYDQLAIINA